MRTRYPQPVVTVNPVTKVFQLSTALDDISLVNGRVPIDGSGVTQPVSNGASEQLLLEVMVELRLLSELINEGLGTKEDLDTLREDIASDLEIKEQI